MQMHPKQQEQEEDYVSFADVASLDGDGGAVYRVGYRAEPGRR